MISRIGSCSTLSTKEVMCRSAGPIREIIFALSATIEGDTTGYYIFKKMKNKEDLVISTIAKGISIGNDLEYTDELTLGRSIVNRVKFSFND